ncbi:MAG: hypothetical protein CM15mP65_10820 [Crocinitomicaceae bacterium]|nr:MAG: hypothetical protein CM15mP65_10820 [Crocinitomicaceae bacterium]
MFSNITLSDALCDGDCNGSAVATGIGGNGGPFTYSWDNVPSSGGISNTNAANGLCDNTSTHYTWKIIKTALMILLLTL